MKIQGQTSSVKSKFTKRLIVLFALMLVTSAGYLMYSQRMLVEHLVEQQAQGIAEGYFDTINTLMLTGGMASRDIPRDKLIAREEILDARIVRSPLVNEIYGPGPEHGKPVDAYDRRGLAGEALLEYRNGDQGRVLTVVMPVSASADARGVNCLGCHSAAEGDMLGAVRIDYSLEQLDAYVNRDLMASVAINSVFIILGIFAIGWMLSTIVTRPLSRLGTMMHGLADGNVALDQRLDVDSDDEIGALAGLFNKVMGRFGGIVDETRKRHEEAFRLKTALDSVTTNVMVADGEYNIIYMNEAVEQMFSDAREDLAERLPGFDPSGLIGRNIDSFHVDPAHQRRLLDGLTETHESRVEVGERTFTIIANPVISPEGERMGTVVEWADISAALKAEEEEHQRLQSERLVAAENQRIRTALDNVSSGVMLADNERNIIYMNSAVTSLFSNAEKDIRKALPNFRAAGLVGTSIDGFHQDPKGIANVIAGLSAAHRAELKIAGRTMAFTANPVIDAAGNRLGTAVEWQDRTDEVSVEHEIDTIVSHASRGELGTRIELGDKQGFFHKLGEGINGLIDTMEGVFDDIATAMSKLSGGDLTHSIEREYTGIFGKVKDDVNDTLARLTDIVGQLNGLADKVGTGMEEIDAGNTNLSSRTESQASSIEQTAATMEELTSTVRNNAENAGQANQLATAARDSAEKGGKVVNEAITAMAEIDRASGKISEIIGVIDEIAFQTNLLALNASVEAARAGEQGRGFAVVATEVRNLAGRSAQAAKEIKELIQDSGAKVRVGSELVNASGETLGEIVTGVKKVGDIIAGITAASAEQSTGIDQINTAVNSLDEVTQQNAALAEETSAASGALAEEARTMRELVAFFKTGDNAATALPRPAAARSETQRPAAAARPVRTAPGPAATSAATRQPPHAPRPARQRPVKNSGRPNDEEWEEF